MHAGSSVTPACCDGRGAHNLAPRGLSRRALRLAINYVEAHLGDSLTLDDLARAAGVSRFHFARLFRISMDASPMEYLLRSRIERAKQILRRSEQPICEIAVSLGFCDQSHFSRAFRRHTGVTPREYARLHGELDDIIAHVPGALLPGVTASTRRQNAESDRGRIMQAHGAGRRV